MAETTAISWADSTWNPWIGCTKVGPGCDHCYASVSTPARSLGVVWGAGQQRRRTSEANWRKPLAWNARPFSECMACGWRGEKRDTKEVMNPIGFHPAPGAVRGCPKCDAHAIKEARRRVFCASLADVFDNEVPEEWRVQLWGLIENTPNLTWLLLTKRIGNAAKMLPSCRWGKTYSANPYPNVWLGATIVNQEEADRDIPKLLATPAAKRFVSYEPALGPVDFGLLGTLPKDQFPGDVMVHQRLDWILVGGESAQPGYPARPFDIQWARDTVRQCREAGVAVFVKQLGSASVEKCGRCFDGARGMCRMFGGDGGHDHDGMLRVFKKDRAGADPAEWPSDLRVREFPDA